jgi:hypothetical protein
VNLRVLVEAVTAVVTLAVAVVVAAAEGTDKHV